MPLSGEFPKAVGGLRRVRGLDPSFCFLGGLRGLAREAGGDSLVEGRTVESPKHGDTSCVAMTFIEVSH